MEAKVSEGLGLLGWDRFTQTRRERSRHVHVHVTQCNTVHVYSIVHVIQYILLVISLMRFSTHLKCWLDSVTTEGGIRYTRTNK